MSWPRSVGRGLGTASWLCSPRTQGLEPAGQPATATPAGFPPFFCSARRVQETDGSFFESYTALSWKQENRRLLVSREGQDRPSGMDPNQERGVGPPPQPGVWWPPRPPDQRAPSKEVSRAA